MAAVTDLDDLRIQPQIRMRALQRPLAERLDLIVQRPAQRADAVLAHAMDAELLDEAVDLAGRDTVDVGLHHDRDDRLLTAPPRLKERREVRARPLLGDLQLDLADPRLPPPRPIPVAMRHPVRGHLAMPGTDLRRHLGVHQLRGDERHRLPKEVAAPSSSVLRTSCCVVILCVSVIAVSPLHRSIGIDRRVSEPAMTGAERDPGTSANFRYTTSTDITSPGVEPQCGVVFHHPT